MIEYRFDQLVDIEQVRQLLQSHHTLSGMEYSILDTEGNLLIVVGWQNICMRFHRANPATLSRCCESDNCIKTYLRDSNREEDYIEYQCQNGMTDVAIPIIIDKTHVATFFTGQFFYDNDRPDMDFFRAQARKFGFDQDEYFQALEQVPTFRREYVRNNLRFLSNMVRILAETGLRNLKLAREKEERSRLEDRLLMMNYALDHIREAAYLIDEEGRYRHVNDEACRMLGYGRNELLTRCVADVNPDFPLERWAEHWHDIKSRGSCVIVGRNKTRDGRIFPVEIYTTYFEFKNRGYHLALVRDITERIQMETALRESEQQFRTLTENSPNIIVRYDRECRRVYVNPAFGRESGLPAEMAQNTIVDQIWPAGTNTVAQEYKSTILHVMETGTPAEVILEWRRNDAGQVNSHMFNVVAERDANGAIIGCLAIGHNITGLREAQSRLARLAETSPGAMFTFLLKPDGTSRMPYISSNVREYGLRPEVMAEDASEAFARIHPDDISRVRRSISESARTLSPWHSEFRVRHPVNGDIWVEGRGTPIFQPDGDILWSGFLHDISDRKATEKSLNAKREQLASMAIELSMAEERERRRIASEIHDNVGQLLLLSRIKLDSLSGMFKSIGDRKAYNEIHDLLARTIRDVRSLTQQLNPPLLASAGLEKALEWLAQKMEADYSLQVVFSNDGSTKPLSEEFAAVLFQSARELLINVTKHAETDRAWLSINRELNTLVLIVEDKGAGFDYLPNPEARISLNSSFGLFNISQRINHLGGELRIQSTPGRGTRAAIRAPLTDGNSIRGNQVEINA